MALEFFLHPVSPTTAARIPFPDALPLEEREDYMTHPPQGAIDQAERVPHVPVSAAPVTDPTEEID